MAATQFQELTDQSIPMVDPHVAEALKQFQVAESYWNPIYREAMIDHRYFVGNELQWNREIRDKLIDAKRPALTFNQLQQFIFYVTSEQAKNPTEGQVNAENNGASEELAQVLQDICRRTRTKSHGKPHLIGYRDMVIGGIGWWELGTEYCGDRSTKQRMIWRPVEGWNCIYIDPLAEYPTFHDADYAFKFKDVSRAEFKRLYGNKAPITSTWDPFNTSNGTWITKDTIRVCEHWYATYRPRPLVGLQDGTTKFQDELGPDDSPILFNSDGEPAEHRVVDFREVFVETISAVEVIEKPVKWMTKYIPLIPVMGEKDTVDGQVHIFGMIRTGRDPQVAANYMRNHLIEAIGRASKAQYLMDPRHTEDFEDYYKDANVENRFFLPAHLLDENGEALGQPIAINPDTPVQEIQQAVNLQDVSLQQSMGSHGPDVNDQRGGIESAEAILARRAPSDRSNYRYTDSFNESLVYATVQELAMIPLVYDVPQVMQLEGLDKKPYKAAVFNSQTQPDVTAVTLADGIKGMFDLSQGEYSVVPSVGPSYDDQRKETQASLAALAQSLGQLPDELRIIIPHWVRAMDFPGHEELADQLTPIAIRQQSGDPQAAAAQAQMQLQQANQQIQHLSQMVQQLTFEKKADQTKAIANAHVERGWQQVELEKNRTTNKIALVKTQADLTKTAAQLSHDGAKEILGHEIGRIQQDKDHLHAVHMAMFDAANAMANQGDDEQEAA